MSVSTTQIFIPDAFYDHILTGELMADPVIAKDNRTYERIAIESCFKTRRQNAYPITSPYNGLPIGSKHRPNIDLRRAIDELREEQSANEKLHIPANDDAAAGESSAINIIEETENDLLSIGDLCEFFECMDSCRDVLENALGGWSPPAVIMIGSENTGKSSVLERLAMMAIFPRSEEICTRLPIHARLRRSISASPPQLVIVEVATQKELMRRVISCQTGFVDVREEMDRLVREQQGSLRGVDSKHMLVLEIRSPRVPSIDLIDLPGIVSGSAAGEPTQISTATRQLALDHIKMFGDRAIYMWTCRAAQSAGYDPAFEIIQEHNLQARCLRVVTMCDLKTVSKRKRSVESHIDTEGLRSILGEDGCGGKSCIRLEPHGYVCVVNAPDDEVANKKMNTGVLRDQDAFEREFFQENGMADLVQQGRAGSNGLVKRLKAMYSKYLVNTWLPKTLHLLDRKLKAVAEKDKDLGLPAGNDEGLVLLDVKAGVQKEVFGNYIRIMRWYLRELGLQALSDMPTESHLWCSHDEAVTSLERLKAKLFDAAEQLAAKVISAWRSQSLQQSLVGDKTPFKFGRFPQVIEALVGRFDEDIDGAYRRAMVEVQRVLDAHFARPSMCIAMECKAAGVEVTIDVQRIANDLVCVLCGDVTTWLRDGVLQHMTELSPDLWIELCQEPRASLKQQQQLLRSTADALISMAGKSGFTGMTFEESVQTFRVTRDRETKLITLRDDASKGAHVDEKYATDVYEAISALGKEKKLSQYNRELLIRHAAILSEGYVAIDEIERIRQQHTAANPGIQYGDGGSNNCDLVQRTNGERLEMGKFPATKLKKAIDHLNQPTRQLSEGDVAELKAFFACRSVVELGLGPYAPLLTSATEAHRSNPVSHIGIALRKLFPAGTLSGKTIGVELARHSPYMRRLQKQIDDLQQKLKKN